MRQNARTARQTIAKRRAANAAPAATRRAQRRIARQGEATLNRHAVATGLTEQQAQQMASSLRSNAKKLGVAGHKVAIRKNSRRTECTRYTVAQVAAIAMVYRPRKAEFKTARNILTLVA